MSKKGYSSDKSTPFGNNPASSSTEQVDGAVYGIPSVGLGIGKIDRRVALPMALNDIYPDPIQPRRAIPSVISRASQGDSIYAILDTWHKYSEDELGKPIDIRAKLYHVGDGDENAEGIPPISHKFLSLVGLAGSIRAEGLTNPITIIAIGDGKHRIETGERRWLAYHILAMYADDGDKWGKIPAIVVDGSHAVWRQAIENNQRQDLNAIEFARQVALLLMDIYASRGSEFLPFDAFEHERDFYAQVADGNQWRVPRGMGEQILGAMGLSDKTQLSRYRDILNLPADLWDVADTQGFTERRIRDILGKDTLPMGNLTPPTPPTENPYMGQFWTFYDKIAKKNTQIASRVGQSERRQMADALRKLADDLEKTK